MNDAIRFSRKIALSLAFGILFVDQLVKYVITGPLGVDGYGKALEILPVFDLTYVENDGVSMGFLSADSEAMRWGLVALTVALGIGVIVWMWHEARRIDIVSLGLVFGGALGNIADRVRLGHVVDFADLHFGAFRPFLVFNIADAAIAIGAFVLVVRGPLVRERNADPIFKRSG